MRLLAIVSVAMWLGAAGCQDPPALTAEDAYLRLLKACDKDDPARLFDALDTPTQWSIESVHHDQRVMKQLILESYPPGDRERALSRIPDAVDEPEEQPRRYYRHLDGSRAVLDDVKHRMYAGHGQPVGSADGKDGYATVWREGGSVFHFARDDKGRWGFTELREFWDAMKVRSNHDVDTVRANAELYRKGKH